MDRAQKAQELDMLNGIFSSDGDAPTEGIVVAHYAGFTDAQMTELRRNSREMGVTVKVTKNTLAKRALSGSQFEGISGLFAGPTCLVYSNDPVATAKAAQEFAEKNEKFVVLGGALGAVVLDAKGVEALSKMPSLDELRGKIVGLIQAPATKIAGVVSAPAGQLARVVGAYAAKDA